MRENYEIEHFYCPELKKYGGIIRIEIFNKVIMNRVVIYYMHKNYQEGAMNPTAIFRIKNK